MSWYSQVKLAKMMPDVAKTKISNKLGRLENEEEQIKLTEEANQGQISNA